MTTLQYNQTAAGADRTRTALACALGGQPQHASALLSMSSNGYCRPDFGFATPALGLGMAKPSNERTPRLDRPRVSESIV